MKKLSEILEQTNRQNTSITNVGRKTIC